MSIVDYFEFIYLISNFELKSRLCDPLYLKKKIIIIQTRFSLRSALAVNICQHGQTTVF